MTTLAWLFLVVLAILLMVVFFMGFHFGSQHSQTRLQRMRLEAGKTERRLHAITEQTFINMAEHAERRRRPPRGRTT